MTLFLEAFQAFLKLAGIFKKDVTALFIALSRLYKGLGLFIRPFKTLVKGLDFFLKGRNGPF